MNVMDTQYFPLKCRGAKVQHKLCLTVLKVFEYISFVTFQLCGIEYCEDIYMMTIYNNPPVRL